MIHLGLEMSPFSSFLQGFSAKSTRFYHAHNSLASVREEISSAVKHHKYVITIALRFELYS